MYLAEHTSPYVLEDHHSQALFYYDQHSTSIVDPHPTSIEEETLIHVSKVASVDDHLDKDQEENFCQICGDTASGWHCG